MFSDFSGEEREQVKDSDIKIFKKSTSRWIISLKRSKILSERTKTRKLVSSVSTN